MFSAEANKKLYPPTQFSCNSNGFNITITQNATVPPLNLDAVWIPSGQSHNCKPPKRSKGAVTFHFPFTDCGAQSAVNVNQFITQMGFCVYTFK